MFLVLEDDFFSIEKAKYFIILFLEFFFINFSNKLCKIKKQKS